MRRGLWLALAASFSFSIMNVVAKALTVKFSAAEVAFFRGLLGTVLTILVMRQHGISLRGRRPALLLVRGLLGAVSLVGSFYAIAHLPLGEASMLAHLSPFFVVLLAHVVLQERMPGRFYGMLALAMLGAMLVIRPAATLSHVGWSVVGLAAAAIGAGAYISIKVLSREHATHLIMLYFMAAATLVPLPLVWHHFTWPGWRDVPLLLTIGLVSYVGQYFLTRAYTDEQASVVATTRYAGILFNVAWGYVAFGEKLSAAGMAGGLCIIAACIGLTLLERKPR